MEELEFKDIKELDMQRCQDREFPKDRDFELLIETDNNEYLSWFRENFSGDNVTVYNREKDKLELSDNWKEVKTYNSSFILDHIINNYPIFPNKVFFCMDGGYMSDSGCSMSKEEILSHDKEYYQSLFEIFDDSSGTIVDNWPIFDSRGFLDKLDVIPDFVV